MKSKKVGWAVRLKRAIRKELDTRKNLKKAKERKLQTANTKSTKKRLVGAGITAAEMSKLRGR